MSYMEGQPILSIKCDFVRYYIRLLCNNHLNDHAHPIKK
eukprot:UN11290